MKRSTLGSIVGVIFVIFIFYVFFKKREHQTLESNSKWVLQLKKGVDPQNFAERHGLKFEGQVGSLEDIYSFHIAEDRQTVSLQQQTIEEMKNSPNVIWAEKQEPKRITKRDINT